MDIYTNEKFYVIPLAFATPEHDQTVALRDELLRKPLGLSFDAEQLAEEYKDFHLACYSHNDELLGCVLLSPVDEDSMKMVQLVVTEACQRKGVGAFLVYASELFAKSKAYTKMMLHARDTAVPFYQKQKYEKKGRAFKEVTLKHYKMYKNI